MTRTEALEAAITETLRQYGVGNANFIAGRILNRLPAGALPDPAERGEDLADRYAKALISIALMNGQSTKKSVIAAEALNWSAVPIAPPARTGEGSDGND